MNSDCPEMSKPLVEVNEELDWPYLFSLIPLIIIGLAGGYTAIIKHVRSVKANRVKEERTGQIEIYDRGFPEQEMARLTHLVSYAEMDFPVCCMPMAKLIVTEAKIK